MDRTLEVRSWRRGFAGGFAALLLAMAGQVTASRLASPEVCPVAQPEAPIAQRLIDKLVTSRDHRGLTQRVALAVLGAMLTHTCS
jgi:hypothetical protein